MKMSLNESARPGAWANNAERIVVMGSFQGDGVGRSGFGAGRLFQLKLQLEMSR